MSLTRGKKILEMAQQRLRSSTLKNIQAKTCSIIDESTGSTKDQEAIATMDYMPGPAAMVLREHAYSSPVKDTQEPGTVPVQKKLPFNIGLSDYNASEDSFDDSVADPDFDPSENESHHVDNFLSKGIVSNADIGDSNVSTVNCNHEPNANTLDRNDAALNGIVEEPVDDAPDKGCRWRKRSRERWSKNERKRQRASGEEYLSSRGKIVRARAPRIIDCGKCRFKCNNNFTAEDRDQLCHDYWNLGDDKRQKDFLLHSIKSGDVLRRRTSNDAISKVRKTPRAKSYSYYLEINANKIRVCKKFLLATLDINHGPLDTAVKHVSCSGQFTGADKRGHHQPWNKTSDEAVKFVKAHIESFPSMESHYTRQSTKRKYLDAKLSITKMYDLYKVCCASQDEPIVPVGCDTYRQIFCENYNLSFFHPKKDNCDVCHKFKESSPTEKEKKRQEYEQHLRLKDSAQQKKNSDKEKANSDKTFCAVTMDLESVLQLPYNDVNQMYYSRKIAVYNFTVYQSAKPNDAMCYCWSEIEGKRGSGEIGTCVLKWISELPEDVKDVSLFSDTCSGQNRNQNMAAALLYAVQKFPVNSITHIFF